MQYDVNSAYEAAHERVRVLLTGKPERTEMTVSIDAPRASWRFFLWTVTARRGWQRPLFERHILVTYVRSRVRLGPWQMGLG